MTSAVLGAQHLDIPYHGSLQCCLTGAAVLGLRQSVYAYLCVKLPDNMQQGSSKTQPSLVPAVHVRHTIDSYQAVCGL